ncbi:hypothetical protein FB451DRAFT_1179260 [Mycena latifolia]|nr:hypothetical protein FB451DRAFT_1179260 [Mycena latifolia]
MANAAHSGRESAGPADRDRQVSYVVTTLVPRPNRGRAAVRVVYVCGHKWRKIRTRKMRLHRRSVGRSRVQGHYSDIATGFTSRPPRPPHIPARRSDSRVQRIAAGKSGVSADKQERRQTKKTVAKRASVMAGNAGLIEIEMYHGEGYGLGSKSKTDKNRRPEETCEMAHPVTVEQAPLQRRARQEGLGSESIQNRTGKQTLAIESGAQCRGSAPRHPINSDKSPAHRKASQHRTVPRGVSSNSHNDARHSPGSLIDDPPPSGASPAFPKGLRANRQAAGMQRSRRVTARRKGPGS